MVSVSEKRRNLKARDRAQKSQKSQGGPDREDEASFQIFVQIAAGRTFAVDVKPLDVVAALKKKVEEKEGLPAAELRLIFGGKQLCDDCTLASYFVGKETAVQVQFRLRGGMRGQQGQIVGLGDENDGVSGTVEEVQDDGKLLIRKEDGKLILLPEKYFVTGPSFDPEGREREVEALRKKSPQLEPRVALRSSIGERGQMVGLEAGEHASTQARGDMRGPRGHIVGLGAAHDGVSVTVEKVQDDGKLLVRREDGQKILLPQKYFASWPSFGTPATVDPERREREVEAPRRKSPQLETGVALRSSIGERGQMVGLEAEHASTQATVDPEEREREVEAPRRKSAQFETEDAREPLKEKKKLTSPQVDMFSQMVETEIAAESHRSEAELLMQQNQDLRGAVANLHAKLHVVAGRESGKKVPDEESEKKRGTLSESRSRFIRAVYKVMAKKAGWAEAQMLRKQNLKLRMSLFALRVQLQVAVNRVQASGLGAKHADVPVIGPVFQERDIPSPGQESVSSGRELACQPARQTFRLSFPPTPAGGMRDEDDVKAAAVNTVAVVCGADEGGVEFEAVERGPDGIQAAIIAITLSQGVTADMIERMEEALDFGPPFQVWWPRESACPSLEDAYKKRFGGILNKVPLVLRPADPRQKFLEKSGRMDAVRSAVAAANAKMKRGKATPSGSATSERPVEAAVGGTARGPHSQLGKPPPAIETGPVVNGPLVDVRKSGTASGSNKADLDVLLSSTSLKDRCGIEALHERIRRTKTCTVFLSSVFNGMEQERTLMMEKYRSRLEEECAKCGVALVFVDMRLGITKAMGDQNLTVLTCLRAARASDIFVGYFATKGRYGWHGESLQPSLKACSTEFPWVARCTDKSVTELEWLAGGLDRECTGMAAGQGPLASLFMYRDGIFDQDQAKEKESRLAELAGRWAELSETEKATARRHAAALSHWKEESDCPHWSLDGEPLPLQRWTLPTPEYEKRKRMVDTWAQGLRERKQQLEALVRKRVAEGWGVHVAGYPQPARGAQIQHDFILRVLSCALPKQGYCSEAIDMWEAHEAFAYSRTRIFTPQSQVHDKVLIELEEWSGRPITLSGSSGGGKSTLAARLAVLKKGDDPDTKVDISFGSRAQRVFWFVGCNAGSTDLAEMLFRVTWKLRRVAQNSSQLLPSHRDRAGFHKVEMKTATDSEDNKKARVVQEFAEIVSLWGDEDAWSEEGAPEVLVVLDALNQLSNKPLNKDEEEPLLPHSLYWLPRHWPQRLRVIITTLSACKEYPSGQIANVLKERNYPLINTPPLGKDERVELIERFFKMHFKKPSDEIIQRVSDSPQTQNPMFLTILLQEVICHGTFGGINQWLSELLGASDVPGLLQRMLSRLVEVFNVEIPDLVGRSLLVIWASREGVTERELLGVLNLQRGKDASGRPGPAVQYTKHWLPLRFAMQRLVQPRAGLWNFSHDFVRQAVERLFLVKPTITEAGMAVWDEDDGKQYHSFLVEDCLNCQNDVLVRGLTYKIRVQHAVMAAFYQAESQSETTPQYGDDEPRAVREMNFHQRRAGLSPAVTVAVRLRPFSSEERVKEDERSEFDKDYNDIDRSIVRISGCQTVVHPYAARGQVGKDFKVFTFDRSMSSLGDFYADGKIQKGGYSQADVFLKLGVPATEQVLDGYDCTILAYGQTGSGKTYTMFGENKEEQQGLIPRLCGKLMRSLATLEQGGMLVPSVTLSMVEIYCEEVFDLFAKDRPPGGLRVLAMNHTTEVEEVVPETFVEGALLRSISTQKEMNDTLFSAFTARSTHSTDMNSTSSRSHCLAAVTINLLHLSEQDDSEGALSVAFGGLTLNPSRLPDDWNAPDAVDEYEIIDPSSSSPSQVIVDFSNFVCLSKDATSPQKSIMRFRIKKNDCSALHQAWIEVDLEACSGPQERARALHGLSVGNDIMLTGTSNNGQPESDGPTLVCPPRIAKLITEICFPCAEGTWTTEQVKESLGAARCGVEGGRMVAVKPTKTLDPTGGLPADWVPPVSVNGYDVVLASRSSVTDAGKESEGVGRREAGGRRGRRKEEEGARKKELGLDFSQLLSKVTQDTAIRFCRKILGGPLEGAWIEVDLGGCSGPEERARALDGLRVGKDVMLTSSFAEPGSCGPSLVCPPRIAKLITEVCFPCADGTWTADQVRESLGAERCGVEEGRLVAVKPTKFWRVGGMRESKLNLVDLAGSERVSKSGAWEKADRMAEAKSINKSLSILGSAITRLSAAGSKGEKVGHVPFRDSKLTRLLQSSLDGTSKIILVGTISPSESYVTETLDTLRYASVAKKIVSRASRRAEEGLLRDVLKTAKALDNLQQVQWTPPEGKFRSFPTAEGQSVADAANIAESAFKSYDWWRGRSTLGAGIGWRGEGGGKMWLEWDVGPGNRVKLASYSIGAGDGSGETHLLGPGGWKLMGNNEEEPTGEAGEEEQGDWIVLDERSGLDWAQHQVGLCTFDVDQEQCAEGEGRDGFRRLRWSFLPPPAAGAGECWVRCIRVCTPGKSGGGPLPATEVEKQMRAGLQNIAALSLAANLDVVTVFPGSEELRDAIRAKAPEPEEEEEVPSFQAVV